MLSQSRGEKRDVKTARGRLETYQKIDVQREFFLYEWHFSDRGECLVRCL